MVHAPDLDHGILPFEDGVGADSLIAVLSNDGAIHSIQQSFPERWHCIDICTYGAPHRTITGEEMRKTGSCWTEHAVQLVQTKELSQRLKSTQVPYWRAESRIVEGSAKATTMSIVALAKVAPFWRTCHDALSCQGPLVQGPDDIDDDVMRRRMKIVKCSEASFPTSVMAVVTQV